MGGIGLATVGYSTCVQHSCCLQIAKVFQVVVKFIRTDIPYVCHQGASPWLLLGSITPEGPCSYNPLSCTAMLQDMFSTWAAYSAAMKADVQPDSPFMSPRSSKVCPNHSQMHRETVIDSGIAICCVLSMHYYEH